MNIKMFKCSKCEKIFRDNCDLSRHINRKNSCKKPVVTQSIDIVPDKKYKTECEYCYKMLSSINSLQKHLLICDSRNNVRTNIIEINTLASSSQREMETVYLLIEREFIKTKEPIFKIGCSKQENDKRIKSYPKGSKLVLQIRVLDCVYIETHIKIFFKEKYKQRIDIGIEYFEGDCISMKKDILNIIDKYDTLSITDILNISEKT